MRSVRFQKGFTLTELLTVIGIISILAIMSFPASSYVFKNAKQTQCMSNLRQTICATNLAMSDNNGLYPIMCGFSWEPPNYGTGPWIANVLSPYVGYSKGTDPAEVLRCPAAEVNNNSTASWLEGQQYSSYRYNVWYAQNHRPQTGNQAMLFFDAVWQNWSPSVYAHFPGTSSAARINVGYTDGSVSSMSYTTYQSLNPSSDESQDSFFQLGWIK
jgi:prepilin-type N-terminal cleavage/methylation domain-containing protein